MKNVRFGIKERLLAAVATVMVLCASLAVGFSMQTGVVARAESDSAIKSVSLTLNENISMNYFVNIPADAAADPAPSMQFTMNTAEEDYTATVTDYETVNGQWKFTYDGVTPQHMCDEVTAVLSYMTDGGVVDESNSKTITLEGVLEKYAEATAAEMNISDAAYEKLQTLVADIAAYGAASQAYLGYEGNGTPAVGTPGEFTGAGLGSDLDLPEAAGQVNFVSAGLWFDNTLGIEVRFTAGGLAADKLAVQAAVGSREKTLAVAASEGGEYYYARMPLSVLEFASPVSFQVTNDGEEVGGALTYSVRTYVNNMQNSATVGELAKAVWNYYTSAAAYTEAASQPPADYRELTSARNDDVAADPGKWYYFADGSEGSSYSFATDGRPVYQNGGVQVTLIELNSGYYYFRYQPGGADDTGLIEGDEYAITFTVELNVAGPVEFSGGNSVQVNANQPTVISYSGTVGTPFYVGLGASKFTDKISVEGMQFRVSNISVEKIQTLEKKLNSDVLANPGEWFYHCNDSAKLDIPPHWVGENAISFSINKLDNQYCQLRYQPDLAEGAQYTLSFTVVANVDCTFRYCGTSVNLKAGEAVELSTTRTVGTDNSSIVTLGFTDYTYDIAEAGVPLTVTISNISIAPVAA